ncbi:tRNA 2-thiouridine(34) synthase MnmA [Bacteroides sp. 519]|uniref:tRNA 2-thiouridine(34) synthase MnmA n=1 Tax=Bacteroides sp. 519 TaxID=2302937 RepID=UPI0013D6D81F|nr:tRNA 2-thiouridine(34) synthase MnmA [Bacteroides sp. 519]NDV58014.1 tRNA 2-thiouridine(34) synthase MnmA [Bacteroides sp. 519]
MCKQNNRVLLGMSGGTDSSVAAILLQDAGYDVTGITFRFYEKDNQTTYLEDARELANRLQIPHLVYDAREVFSTNVIEYFINEYMSGRTPVPCAVCNNMLKWPLLAKVADENGINHISTGHYVKKEQVGDTYFIKTAKDPEKDQSFFLWGLKQNILSRMILPMGDILKSEARGLAQERGYQKVAQKKDSIGVCFCPFDYHTFLKEHVDNRLFQRGRFLDEEGNFIAFHQGYPFYTVGQRRGLGIHLNKAVFVKEINPTTNDIVLSPLKSLEKTGMVLKNWNIVDEKALLNHNDIIVKIRYRKQENHCTVSVREDGLLDVTLHEPLTAIAPGQAAAFYKDGLVLGGGIIV